MALKTKVDFGRRGRKTATLEEETLKPIKYWSYSVWSTWKQCPFKLYCRSIIKMPFVPNAAMKRGTSIHGEAEDHVKSGKPIKIKDLGKWKKRIAELRKWRAAPEEKHGFTRAFEPIKYWDATLRMVFDARVSWVKDRYARVIDYKTGRIYDDHADQGSLYALGAFINEPKLENLDVEFWYIDQNKLHVHEYSRTEFPLLERRWKKEQEKVLTDDTFIPRPGFHCKRCDYAKSKGGPCAHG